LLIELPNNELELETFFNSPAFVLQVGLEENGSVAVPHPFLVLLGFQ
jgi:hypothetical protein